MFIVAATQQKCYVGQLGLGDSINRGNAAGQMGDSLPPVELAKGPYSVSKVATGMMHTCALLALAPDLDAVFLKCFGSNFFGDYITILVYLYKDLVGSQLYFLSACITFVLLA